MISVALCTYNGKDFLPAQLNSLLEQTLQPKELVVCDDASLDVTVHIVEAFAAIAPFPVRLFRNEKRIGIGANFEQAISLCYGEVIALCDQDDVWMPEKLARLAALFAEGAQWVCCDAKVVDANLGPLGYNLWERVNFNRKEKDLAQQGRWFEVLLKHFVVAGAALAFKADFRTKLLPIPANWLYDAWLTTMLAATTKGMLLDEPMQYYRQHGDNALGGLRRSLWSEVQAALSLDRDVYYEEEIARWSGLVGRLDRTALPEIDILLAAKIEHLRRRSALPKNRLARLPMVAAETARGGYARYARNWGSIGLDLLVN